MPVQRRRTRLVRRNTRRRTQWVDARNDIAAIPIGDFTVIDLLAGYRAMPGAETAGVTLLRHHLDVWVTSSPVTVGDGVAVGVAVDDSAEVIGNTALGAAHAWNPQDQPYLPWTLYRRWNAHPTYAFEGAVNQFSYDIKSKRRIPFGSTLLMAFINVDAAAPVTFSIHSRALLALS